MSRLTLLVGPPGSGKSTLAKEYASKGGVVYISQDEQGKDHLRQFNEAMDAGKDVVVDRMNFSKGQRNRYLDVARAKGYQTYITVVHESYHTCFHRCLSRPDHPTIKDEINARAALNTFFTKYERVSDDEADKVVRIWPEGEKPSAIICDLDGTLCDVAHRRHFVRRDPGVKKDWQGFFKGMVNDTPMKWCADILKAMSKNHTIVYCSGRPDNWRHDTVCWLKNNDLFQFEGPANYDFHLYMRPRGDSRDDSLVKEIILDFELLTRFTPYFMIDDRKRVVDMWRSRGYTCLHCEEGDF